MIRFLPYVLKNLWRHRTRTMLTASGAAVTIFVFAFVGSVQEGLDRLAEGRQGEQRLIVFQANRFCPSTSKLPEDYARQIESLEGVKAAIPVKVYMNNCRASLDVVVFHGMPAEKLRTTREIALEAGDWKKFESHRDAAIIGRALAARRRIQLGQRFSIGTATVTVAGICSSPVPANENFIYTHLEFLQRLPGIKAVGTSTQIEVLLEPDSDPRQLAELIDDHFRAGSVETNTRPLGAFQLSAIGDLLELVEFLRYLAIACIALLLVLVGTTALMAVQDRIKEFAVLQAIGFSGARLFQIVLTESMLLSTFGGSVGAVLAAAFLTWGKLTIGTEGILVPFLATPRLLIAGLLISLVTGVLAGLSPAWTAARAEIVSGLRN